MARLRKSCFPAAIILGIGLLSIHLTAENARRWTMAISGTLQIPAGNDLDGLVDAEKNYLDLYFRNNPAYQTLAYPGLSKSAFLLGGGVTIQYRLNPRVRLGAGLDFLQGNAGNRKTFVFRTHQDWRIINDSLDYRALDTRISLFFPHLRLGYALPLQDKLDLEIGIQAGPAFARVRWKRHIVDIMDVVETGSGFNYRLYEEERSLVMKGSGTGIGAGAGLTVQWRISRPLGVFLEAGYRFYYLPSLKGSSSLTAGGVVRNWQGEWFLVRENVEREWGSAAFTYPANDPYLASRGAGTFRTEIHGIPSLRLGVFLFL